MGSSRRDGVGAGESSRLQGHFQGSHGHVHGHGDKVSSELELLSVFQSNQLANLVGQLVSELRES